MVHKVLPKTDTTQTEDKLINLIGQIGKWQLIIFLSVFLIKFSSGWVQLAIVFLTPNTKFWCTEFASNASQIVENNSCFKDCVKYEYDSSPMNSTIISEWQLICERSWLASFTQTVLQLGILLGSIIFGFLSDRFGRKYTFLTSVVLLLIFSFSIPFAPDYWTFTALRFLLGLATAGTMVISFVIIIEVTGPKYRELLGCLFQIPFILGHASVPAFAYFFRDWNAYLFALSVPMLMYLGYFFLISESPRWLVSVGRVEEATNIVEKAALMNGLPTEKIHDTLTKLSNEIQNNKLIEPKLNYLDLIRTPSLRKLTLCSGYIWFVAGLSFFGTSQYVSRSSPDPFISVAAAGAIQLPANFLAIWLIKAFGRKASVISSFSIGGIIFITLGLVPKIFALQLALGTLGVSFAALVCTAIYIHSMELFPTVVRNMGMGVVSMSMRLGSMIAPFIANLSSAGSWLPTLIFGLAPISAGLICFMLPETKGRKMPNSIEDAES